jgi:hypothetical protein
VLIGYILTAAIGFGMGLDARRGGVIALAMVLFWSLFGLDRIAGGTAGFDDMAFGCAFVLGAAICAIRWLFLIREKWAVKAVEKWPEVGNGK